MRHELYKAECERLAEAMARVTDDTSFTNTLEDVSDLFADGMMKPAELEPSLSEELQKSLGRQLLQHNDYSVYGILLCITGTRGLGMVTKALSGRAETVQEWPSDAPRLRMDVDEKDRVTAENMKWCAVAACVRHKRRAIHDHIDSAARGCGHAERMASALYVVPLIPQITGAPVLPLLVDANDSFAPLYWSLYLLKMTHVLISIILDIIFT